MLLMAIYELKYWNEQKLYNLIIQILNFVKMQSFWFINNDKFTLDEINNEINFFCLHSERPWDHSFERSYKLSVI